MDILDILFDDSGHSVKNIAIVCFFLCLVVAAVLILIGSIRILSAVDEYTPFREVLAYTAEDYAYGLERGFDWYVNGYMGKMQCKTALYIALASFCSIPLYAFGCLLENIVAIKKKLYQEKED